MDSLSFKQFLRSASGSIYFWVGLIIRLSLIIFARPAIHLVWFVPFIEKSQNLLDPWTSHLKIGGDPLSFPYGPVMFISYLPGVLFGNLIGDPYLTFALTTLFLDLIFFWVMHLITNCEVKKLIWYTWLSPIILYVCYWHGQLDLLPVLLFLVSFLYLKNNSPTFSGIFLALAVSAKLSMALAAPIMLIYIWRNTRVSKLFKPFLYSLTAGLILGLIPVTYSSGFWQMVLGSPEMQKVYSTTLSLGLSQIYLLPVVYSLILYTTWKLERLSNDLLFTLTGISFFLVLLLSPAATGWFLWVVPFLAASQVKGENITVIFGVMFSVLYVATSFLFASGPYFPIFNFDFRIPLFSIQNEKHLYSLALSGLWTLGALISIRGFIHYVQKNDFYRLSRYPLSLGIGGDSGSGKDTLAEALAGIFGGESVTSISGDDYHRWNRRAPMWQALTHLDPRANDLQRLTRDVINLLDGKAVVGRRYDHETGRFHRGEAMKRKQVMLLSGLHILYIPQIRSKLDVSIFLDMDPHLRRHLKIKRDVIERGKSISSVEESMQRRALDSEKFINPQGKEADIVFQLQVTDLTNIEGCIESGSYKLKVRLAHGINFEDVTRVLIGVCGMRVDVEIDHQNGGATLIVEGKVSAMEIEVAAKDLCINIQELLAIDPEWREGMLGVMQLFILSHVSDVLHNRLLSGLRYANA